MRSVLVIMLSTMLAFTANAQTTDPNKLKDQLTGDAKVSLSANPQCKLFTQTEIAGYAGAEVGPGESSAGGAGCNWHNKNYSASVTVSVVSPKYFPEPSAVKGFKRLPNVGTRGWVAPDSGWSAGAVTKEAAVVVVVSGKTATEASAVALLLETMKRRQ